MTMTQMYWLTRLDNILTLGKVVMILGFGALMASAMLLLMSLDLTDVLSQNIRKNRLVQRMFAIAAILVPIGISTLTFVPTTKEMAAIYVVPKIVNNENLQDAGNRLYDLATDWMDALSPKNIMKEIPDDHEGQ